MNDETPVKSQGPAMVVGLGASAGGVEALSEFFEALPADLPAAYVVVMHLSPDVESTLDRVLARVTPMPVVVVEDEHELLPGHLYVAPPRGSMDFRDGMVLLSSEGHSVDDHGIRHPIDRFFDVLGARWRDRGIAVVLSGSGSDGAEGVRAVRANGGLVMVHDPDDAQFGSMPRKSAANARADVIDSPTGLAAAVARVLGRAGGGVDLPESANTDPIEEILAILRESTGYDFRGFRRSTVYRRVARRVAISGADDTMEYLSRIGTDAAEREALCQDLLINVTEFFRDTESFDALDRKVIRSLAERAGPRRAIRIWVPACATGEEAYTIAMLVDRALGHLGKSADFQLFASDIDPTAIEIASQGYYPKSIESRIPPALLDRYFVATDEQYRVRRSLRERMVFAVHDISQDPPFMRMDLVSCRNLLIYFRTELQNYVLQLLGYALRDDGYLFLGSSENASAVREIFDGLEGETHLFKRNGKRVVAPRVQSIEGLLRPAARPATPETVSTRARSQPRTSSATHAAVVEHLVGRHGGFGFVLDEKLNLLHVYGEPGQALRVPRGGITTEVGALTRGEFRTALLTSAQRALRLGTEVQARSVRIDVAEDAPRVDLSVAPAIEPSTMPCVLVFVTPAPDDSELSDGSPTAGELRTSDLEDELHHTRGRLARTIEELEIANEELQTSNEELMATNEELQSTNEELQSTNEELHTVNAEHHERILELTEVTHDLENVMSSSEVGTILLDPDLHIRKFTTVATKVVHLMDQDRGRPLHHITNSLVDFDLSSVVRAAIEDGTARETTVRTTDGHSYLMRCRSLQDDDGKPEGAMLTFTDVTSLERMADELRESEQRFRHVMRHLQQAVFLRRRVDQRFEFVSAHATALFDGADPVMGLDQLLEYVHEDDQEAVRRGLGGAAEGSVALDFRLVTDGDEERWLHCSVRSAPRGDGASDYDVGYLSEITRRKRSELALRRQVERFEGFVEAIPDRFFWCHTDGEWERLRPWLSHERGKDGELTSIVSHNAMRAIEAAAETARSTGERQTIDFDAHDTRESRSYEARLLMVGDQGVLCVLRDVSDLRRTERELVNLTRSLEREANSDHLTRLPNRRGLEKVLFNELERCRRLGSRLCAILVDCDNFKRVNDTMGHATGDVVLQEIGKRLRSVVRPSDTIGRVGGDEFLVLLPDTRHAEALQLAERLRLAITGSPLTSGNDVIGITGSLGVSTIPPDVVSIEELISLTQHALAHSKRAGKNRVTSHEYGSDGEAIDPRSELLSVLETGRGFRTFAQPILDLQTGIINGYELLTRGPGGALESPADIFQLSSENNILTSVDLHCVKRNVGWALDHLDRGRFHVNLFPSTILDTPAARLLAVFGDPGLLQHFCVEISEQQFIGDPNYLKPHVEELRREGARIALDDVGFGRSSLESLLLLEPDTVKLDKSVVRGAAEDDARRRTLERLVGVVRGIDADIVAEGIETQSDHDLLVELGVEFGQGYLFGRPSDRLVNAN